jgi:hypothetical protein
VVDEESWPVIMNVVTEPQRNELLTNMAALIFSLTEVDPHIEDKPILTPTRQELEPICWILFFCKKYVLFLISQSYLNYTQTRIH